MMKLFAFLSLLGLVWFGIETEHHQLDMAAPLCGFGCAFLFIFFAAVSGISSRAERFESCDAGIVPYNPEPRYSSIVEAAEAVHQDASGQIRTLRYVRRWTI